MDKSKSSYFGRFNRINVVYVTVFIGLIGFQSRAQLYSEAPSPAVSPLLPPVAPSPTPVAPLPPAAPVPPPAPVPIVAPLVPAGPPPATGAPAAPDPSAQNVPAPQSLNDLLKSGLAAFNSGDNAGAAASFELLLSQATPDPKLEPIYLTLADAYMRSEQFAAAVQTLKKFLERYPASGSREEAIATLGYAALKSGDFASAIAAYQLLQTNPKFQERALLGQGKVYFEWQQYDSAISALRQLMGDGIRSSTAAEGALLLVECYAKVESYEKAASVLQMLHKKPQFLTNIFQLNALAFKLGDSLLEKKKPAIALECYQMVFSKQRVIALQEDSLKTLNNSIEGNLRLMRANPQRIPELLSQNTILSQSQKEGAKMLKAYQSAPDFSTAFLLRLARAYSDTGQHWEALAVYGEFLREYPADPKREEALFGIVTESAETNRIEQTRRYAEIYLHDYPESVNADAVGYLLGATSLLADDPKSAESYFGRILRDQPDSKFREQMRFMLGNARFALGKYELARSDYQRYIMDYPAGVHQEEANYRIGLCQLLLGQYTEAMKTISDYIKGNPTGYFIDDARYRLAVCKFSLSQYPQVIADCNEWLRIYSGRVTLLGEVIALKADALAGVGKDDEAIENYLHAYKVSTTDSAIGYCLFSAQKLYQKKRQWDKIETLFTDFVQNHPRHPAILAAILTAAQAKVRQKKIEEAKIFVADAALLTIGDTRRDSVEDLLSELATLCVKSHPKISSSKDTRLTTPQMDMNQLLASAHADVRPITQARLLYASGQILQSQRDTQGRDLVMRTISNKYEPKVLSPALLAMVGDYNLENGDDVKAAACYGRLLKAFPKSIYREFATVGMGEIALRKGQNEEALAKFTAAIEDDGANIKLKEATIGKANALLALGRLDESKALFEAAVSTRAWRGETTAQSIYTLGTIEKQEGNIPKAIEYFQRVYIGYRSYLPLVAKAYEATADCYQKLGNTKETRAVYEELLNNPKLSGFTEYSNARKRLDEMDKG